jgi:hypothetical protein
MPAHLIKMPTPNPATADRVREAQDSIAGAFRSLAPAVQKAGEEMGWGLAQMRSQRRP